jgi:hypothetical protein
LTSTIPWAETTFPAHFSHVAACAMPAHSIIAIAAHARRTGLPARSLFITPPLSG